MTINTALPRIVARVIVIIAIGASAVLSHAQSTLTMPVWADIFDSTGSAKDIVGVNGASGSNGKPDYVDLYSAQDAVFVGDNISNSVGTDMSVSGGEQVLANTIVSNNTVAAKHDLGNGFVMAMKASNNDLILYAGMEHIASSGNNSYVEFEFNQEVVQAIGINDALQGERKAGDLQVRVMLDQGVVTGAQAKRWTNAGQFAVLDTMAVTPGVACSGEPQSFLVCDPWLASGQHNYETAFDPWTEGWNMAGNPITPTQPNAVLEFAINVGAIMGSSPEYTSIVVRTPQDITLTGFRNIGHWSQSN